MLSVIRFTILVDLDYGAVDYEGTIISEGLQALTIITITELRQQVLVNDTLLVVLRVVTLVHLINVLNATLTFIVTIILEVTKNLREVFHVDIDAIGNHLLLQP